MKKVTSLIAILVLGCGGFRVEKIFIPPSLKPGGVLIEFENPRCPPADVGFMSREFTIDEAGYACTSSTFDRSLTYWQYYRIDRPGKLTKLEVGQDIFAPGSLGHTVGGRCNVKAEVFLYGHITQGPVPRDYSETLHAHHPECPDVIYATREK